MTRGARRPAALSVLGAGAGLGALAAICAALGRWAPLASVIMVLAVVLAAGANE